MEQELAVMLIYFSEFFMRTLLSVIVMIGGHSRAFSATTFSSVVIFPKELTLFPVF